VFRNDPSKSLARWSSWVSRRLHIAAQVRATDVARLLLDHGAQVDPPNVHGNTPLSVAVFNSRGEGLVSSCYASEVPTRAAELERPVPVGLARHRTH
jgi:hypothetical protein